MLSRMKALEVVFIISSWDRGEVAQAIVDAGLRWRKAAIGYLGFAKPAWLLKNIFYMPLTNARIVCYHLVEQPKAYVFAEPLCLINAIFAFLLIRVFSSTRFVFYLGDIGGGTVVQRFIKRVALSLADVVIVNSEAVRQGIRVQGLQNVDIKVVYNGVELPRFQSATAIPRTTWVDWNDHHFVFGYVGQLKQNKGIEDFLDAARLVSTQDPNSRFLVVGGCPQGSEYPGKLRDKYVDLGSRLSFVEYTTTIEAYYRTMDCVIVPSRYQDPAPNVNLEAMASGLPVIATNMGGSPELIADDTTGYLVSPHDPAELAKRMLQFSLNSELAKRFGEAGLQRCCEKFDVEKNSQTVQALILGIDVQGQATTKTAAFPITS